MKLNGDQIGLLAKYFADLSKILFGSVIIGYFLPSSIIVNLPTFMLGSSVATVFIIFSVKILKKTV